MGPLSLPIDAYLDEIRDAARRSRAVVVTAEPGAGKTTRVPPALVDSGPVMLLQPRRVAARAMAARIAAERGWTIGDEIGWQIRFEKRFSAKTRLLVATEGILTARLQSDPLLAAFTTIVLDEFHERSLHADLAIALAKQAWRARDDLRIVVMSATLDTRAVSAYLDGCPIVHVPGRLHAIDVSYAPDQQMSDAVGGVMARTPGDVLCFLPGALEIRRAIEAIERRVASTDAAVEVVPLHGSLNSDEQDRALAGSAGRRVIVATNIAETSVTVPGVTAVVDSGLHKVARYDASRGVDSLETERITQDAADQRAGRAGRVAPGVVVRLWQATDRLRPHREAEIHRVDLAAASLDVIAWGGDPRELDWFEAPRPDAIEAALLLLTRLGVIAGGRLTPIGERLRRLPLHPRLARMLLAADGAREVVRAAALLSERHFLPPRTASTASDLLSALDGWQALPPHIHHAAEDIQRAVAGAGIARSDARAPMTDAAFCRAILAGYPDRVARRREPASPRVRLASGAGAVIAPQSGVRDGDFLVALDVQAGSPDATIRMASRVDREWLEPNGSEIVHRFEAGIVRASRVDRYDALVLAEHPATVDPAIAASLLAQAWLDRGPREGDEQLLRRARFAAHAIDLAELVRSAAMGARSLDAISLADALPFAARAAIDRDAPTTLLVPSGRAVPLLYAEDGSVSASVKLQELFGLAETPRIGPRREPVVFALLAPNGRPVQITRDLRSFWDRTYPEVRKELRGRYPKHPWPDDPWTARPTARPTRRP